MNPLILGKEWDARKVEPEQSFIIVGKKSTYDEVVELFRKNNIERACTFVEASDEALRNGDVKIKNTNNYNHILFDASYISYDTMIKTLDELKGEGLRIATYSVKTKVLITDGFIYNSDGVVEL